VFLCVVFACFGVVAMNDHRADACLTKGVFLILAKARKKARTVNLFFRHQHTSTHINTHQHTSTHINTSTHSNKKHKNKRVTHLIFLQHADLLFHIELGDFIRDDSQNFHGSIEVLLEIAGVHLFGLSRVEIKEETHHSHSHSHSLALALTLA